MVAEPVADLGRPRRIHVVGVGGAGMSAIATVLAAMGHTVSGSDQRPSAALDRLEAAGVRVHVGHDPVHVAGVELVAVSTAIPADNPEVAAALAADLPVLTRAQILAAIAATRSVLAVAGTHGKTTTSAILTQLLVSAGVGPSWIVGGDIVGLGGAGWNPAGAVMVVEADESDGTFLVLPRRSGIVTSVEADHLEYYGDEAAMVAAYDTFLEGCGGTRVVCADDPGAAALGRRLVAAGLDVVTYGTAEGATWRMTSLEEDRLHVGFALDGPGLAPATSARLAVPGLHNARNAVGAVALAVAAGVDPDVAVEGLSQFAGVARRLERRGERDGVTYIDDYAHLPGEVATVVATVARAGWDRVVVVFQPHRYSRTANLHASFADAFAGAEVLIVTGIYPSGEAPRPGVTGRLVHDAVAAAHPGLDLRYCEELSALPDVLAGELRPGDCCLTLGAGDLTTIPSVMLERP